MSAPTERSARVLAGFERAFAAPAERLVRSPGRVIVIGEHTDYNDGFVLPAALDVGTDVAVRRRDDRMLRTVARRFGAVDCRPLSALLDTRARRGPATSPGAAVLQDSGFGMPGADIYIDSPPPSATGDRRMRVPLGGS